MLAQSFVSNSMCVCVCISTFYTSYGTQALKHCIHSLSLCVSLSPLFLPTHPLPPSSSLQYAQMSSGKCHAWIRLAVNECSLESYITVLTPDSKLLSQYYESYGFLRDTEMVAALTQLLAGLTQINFNMLVKSSAVALSVCSACTHTLCMGPVCREVYESILEVRSPSFKWTLCMAPAM